MTLDEAATRDRPRFSIVSAVYNVSQYLPEFIESIEAQDFPLSQVEVIVVDDGSTDDSLEILNRWQERRPELVTVLTKSNGGQASARNLGLEHARGEWITFTDPDDILDTAYLTEVDHFLAAKPQTYLVATKRVLFDEETRLRRAHPLDRHFTKRNRLRNLDNDTGHFHGSAPAGFFRGDEITKQGLRFDERIRPVFEDSHFCCAYVLRAPTPLVGFIQSAIYLYRKRANGTSSVDTSWADPGRYSTVPEHGYLSLLRRAIAERGAAPAWLQGMIVYELKWYFRTEDQVPGIATAAKGQIADRFNDLMSQITDLLDPEAIEGYVDGRLNRVYRDILLHAYRAESWHAPYAVVDRLDMRQRLLRVSYRFTGTEPAAEFYVDGTRVGASHQKVRGLRYFDRILIHERIAWLPFGTVRVVLDGNVVDTRTREPGQPTHHLDSRVIRRLDPDPDDKPVPARRKRRSLVDLAVVRAAQTSLVRRYFGGAWVLMDRINNANDNAEHLFRHLRKRNRDVNAWFVIEAGTADYRRLRRDGYKRIVPHGSLRWKLLMLNCDHLISSHIDAPVIRPSQITRLTRRRWRYTFLQHGVTKDDISRWLNIKDIDVMITSTPGEHESIVGDDTSYKLTTREVARTGFPRFDRLRQEGDRCPPEKRDLILIAPTWRQWLTQPAPPGGHRRGVDVEALLASDFVMQWTTLLNSPDLHDLADANGLTIGLLLHPNLQSTASELDLPADVKVLRFEEENVGAIFARARVMVTDYSSMSFDAAYLERPLVYFQFDAERFFAGGHIGRTGYFDFRRDGYGPVVDDVDDAVKAIIETVDFGAETRPEYRQRIEAAFPNRDGRCCARVVSAIRRSTRRAQYSEQVLDPLEVPVPAASPGDDTSGMPGAVAVNDEGKIVGEASSR